MAKMAPKKVRICPGCPPKDLELDYSPQFIFSSPSQESSMRISLVGNVKEKIKGLKSSLF